MYDVYLLRGFQVNLIPELKVNIMISSSIYQYELRQVEPYWSELEVLEEEFVAELTNWITQNYYANSDLDLSLESYSGSVNMEPHWQIFNEMICGMLTGKNDVLIAVWGHTRHGIRTSKTALCEIVSDIWRPGLDELYIIDENRSFLLYIHHEDVIYLFDKHS